METNVIARKWDAENLEKWSVQSAWHEVCQMCQVDNWGLQEPKLHGNWTR